jgi:DNA-binding transcriptional LysR family regulator
MLDINWNALYGFWLIAVHGSYAEAARVCPAELYKLCISAYAPWRAPKISTFVLFLSKGVKGIELTEAGTRLCQLLDPIFRDLDRIVAELRGEDCGSLHLACTGFSSYNYVPDIIVGFGPKYPRASVHLHMCEAPEVIRLVQFGLVDFGICSGESTGLEIKARTTVRYAVVMPRGHRLEASPISWAHLAREPLILPERTGLRLAFDDLVRRNGLASRVQLKAEMTLPEVSLEAVRAGMGVALMAIGPRMIPSLRGLVHRPAPLRLVKLELQLVCSGTLPAQVHERFLQFDAESVPPGDAPSST